MDLGRQDDPVPAGAVLRQPFAKEALRRPNAEAAAVLVSGVDEVHPRRDGVALLYLHGLSF